MEYPVKDLFSLYLQNISSSSNKVGTRLSHNRSRKNGSSIIDVESTGSGTKHQKT